MITQSSHMLLRLFRHYEGGWLALEGGLLNQPNNYLEAMELLGQTFNRIASEKAKQLQGEH